MTNLALATCDLALPPGRAPEWVHIFPGDGQVKGRDGRAWELIDPAALVLAFQSGGIDLPIDYEHQNDKPEAKLNGPVPAAGWIKELEADDGGVWGRVEWTATASEMIGRREYRFLSPSFLFHPKTRQIVKLKGAGLVHNPNLHLTALANQDDQMTPETIPAKTPSKPAAPGRYARLADALKVSPDATEEEMIAALMVLLKGKDDPNPAKFVPVATVQAMLAERNLSLATASEERAGQKVEEALRSGHLSPAMKDWATALCMANEASFDNFIASSVPQFAHIFKTTHTAGTPPGTRRGSEEGEFADAICSQLGLKPGSLTE